MQTGRESHEAPPPPHTLHPHCKAQARQSHLPRVAAGLLSQWLMSGDSRDVSQIVRAKMLEPLETMHIATGPWVMQPSKGPELVQERPCIT
jgi:hypothetical protein